MIFNFPAVSELSTYPNFGYQRNRVFWALANGSDSPHTGTCFCKTKGMIYFSFPFQDIAIGTPLLAVAANPQYRQVKSLEVFFLSKTWNWQYFNSVCSVRHTSEICFIEISWLSLVTVISLSKGIVSSGPDIWTRCVTATKSSSNRWKLWPGWLSLKEKIKLNTF